MIESIKHFGKFCIFKGTPADVDGSTRTLVVLFLILWLGTFGIGWSGSVLFGGKYWSFADEAVSQLTFVFKHAATILGIFLVLNIGSVRHKFRETLSSYLGASICIALVLQVFVVIGVLLSINVFNESAMFGESQGYTLQIGSLMIVALFVIFLYVVWLVSVVGYILSKSLEVTFWQCGLLAIFLIYAPEAFTDFFEIISRSIVFLVSFGTISPGFDFP